MKDRSLTLRVGLLLAVIPTAISAAGAEQGAGQGAGGTFERLTLSEEFFSEGATAADIDSDGNLDIVSGPFWYRGPDFKQRCRYAAGESLPIKAYSNHFFSFVDDFNGDDHPDILVVGMPGTPAQWYENPGHSVTEDGLWTAHLVLEDAGGESPMYTDLTGDGRPELLTVTGGRFGFSQPDRQRPTEPWTFTPISEDRGYGRFTHGLGVGDVNNDGRLDVLETHGWYEQPARSGEPWTFHAQRFAESGGAQMFVYDFDGDGDHDVVSVQNAHGWGLSWFERRGRGDDMLWVEHPILSDPAGERALGPAISQMHALALADIDGDGVEDLVTGKRFFAHGGADPGAFQLPVLYWLRTVRSAGGVRFEPHLIDRRSGVGTQLSIADFNGDGRADIVVGNKLGTYVLINHSASDSAAERIPGSPPGTADFAAHIRESPWLPPEQEQQTFVLPPGFEAQLFAAEPQIAKPLNMAFDARGRLWLTDTLEYPYPVEVGKPGRDSVKILEDTDGDGRADKITTFADGLNIPIGLYPYQDGVICYSIPHIWFLRDTDGDGRCDQRQQLYGPFDHTRDTHGMCNSFTRGFDGWLYACHGFNNHSTVAGSDGHRVTMQSGNTFRMRLDGSRIEHYTHGQVNPFGMAYDAHGNLLTADCHTKPITLLMRGGYYESFGKPHDGLGFVPDVMDHLHGSTAIGGIAVCTDRGSFPDVYQHSAFGGNVMTSRVNRNRLEYSGSSVCAREEADFLISGDPWFRPVDLQFGPDGALYVADFYNRVIGHYEVPLDHPARDRSSGRIWRIVYRGEPGRRDFAPGDPVAAPALSGLDVAALISQLAADTPSQRMLAADEIVDRCGPSAVTEVRRAWQESTSESVRLHALWILFRLGALSAADLDQAFSADSARVRAAACRVTGELPSQFPGLADRLREGIRDADPSVARAAAQAAGRHGDDSLVPALLARYRTTPSDDPHLRHAIRMSLRDQLQDSKRFAAAVAAVGPDQIELMAGICLALQTPAGAQFVADHLDVLARGPQRPFTAYVRFAMAHLSPSAAEQIVAIIRKTFADDRAFQLELLHSIPKPAVEPSQLPPSISDWATDLAAELLAADQRLSPLPWVAIPFGPTEPSQPTWVLSDRRQSADGEKSTLLWSSYPRGEQRTGIYRSGHFRLPEQFEFFLAGHDGFPDQPPQHRNLVRLRDARTEAILQVWYPPRSDVAAQQQWDTGVDAGREVYLELVDGDPGAAYAWLAAGRFSVPELNPSRLLQDRRDGAALAGQFRLRPLRDELVDLARRSSDPATRAALCRAVAALHRLAPVEALAETLTLANLDPELQDAIINAIADGQPDQALFDAALRSATTAEQWNVATGLATDRDGIQLLLNLVSAGRVARGLLLSPQIQSRLEAAATADQRELVQQLTATVADEQQDLDQRLAQVQSAYTDAPGDVASGQSLFAKHCAACHQVGGVGQSVGPNLDGIGNRGLARICEDLIAPNRNVDVAFRSSNLLTDDGRAVVGLIKHETDAELILYDSSGKQHQLDPAAIITRKESVLSPMPANFAELLTAAELRDLLAYLLSLNR